jgi:hypothetical protein
MKRNNLNFLKIFVYSFGLSILTLKADLKLVEAFKNTPYIFTLNIPGRAPCVEPCLMGYKEIDSHNKVYQLACRDQLEFDKQKGQYTFYDSNLYRNGCGLFVLRDLDKLNTMLHARTHDYSDLIKDFYDADDHKKYFQTYVKILKEQLGMNEHYFTDLNPMMTEILINNLPSNLKNPFMSMQNITFVEDIKMQNVMSNPFAVNGNVLGNLFNKMAKAEPFTHGIIVACNRQARSQAPDHLVGLLVARDTDANMRYFILDPEYACREIDRISDPVYNKQVLEVIRHIMNKKPIGSYLEPQEIAQTASAKLKERTFQKPFIKPRFSGLPELPEEID